MYKMLCMLTNFNFNHILIAKGGGPLLILITMCDKLVVVCGC